VLLHYNPEGKSVLTAHKEILLQGEEGEEDLPKKCLTTRPEEHSSKTPVPPSSLLRSVELKGGTFAVKGKNLKPNDGKKYPQKEARL